MVSALGKTTLPPSAAEPTPTGNSSFETSSNPRDEHSSAPNPSNNTTQNPKTKKGIHQGDFPSFVDEFLQEYDNEAPPGPRDATQ